MQQNQGGNSESQDKNGPESFLKAIHHALTTRYNAESASLQGVANKSDSINATNFLAGQAIMFGDAALFLLEDARQPLGVPVALLRTILEAQARANHIIASKGSARECLAGELVQMMNLGHEYYEKKVVALSKDLTEAQLLPRDRPYYGPIQALHAEVDITDLKVVKKSYDELSRNWTYGKVVERDKFKDPVSLARSEAQPLQPALDLTYTQCCAFVHCDPVSIRHQSLLTRLGVIHTIVLSELIGLMCFLTALGKENDDAFVHLKKLLIGLDINECVLPKSWLTKSEPANSAS